MTKIQILVIDDDAGMQVLLTRELSRQGYNVLLASNGKEGLEKALEHRPALIICDWMMPHMTGIDVCHQIKATVELSTTFFILLTNLNSVDDLAKGLDAGADDFLSKPIDRTELNARLRSGLRQHQLSHDLKKQKEIIEAELAEAAEYVKGLLPKPLTCVHLSINTRFIPSSQLGGDCFDYYWLDSEHLAMYLLDVSGHGLRSALPSLAVLNLLRSRGLTNVNFYQPSEVLKGLNTSFKMINYNTGEHLTMWYGVYHCQKKQLVYSTAGHPPAVLLSPDRRKTIKEKRLKTRGFPIGFFDDSEYIDDYCQIPYGSNLYLFSDGIYEIEQNNGPIWGLENFIELLKLETSSQHNLDSLLQKISYLNTKNYFADDLSIMQICFH